MQTNIGVEGRNSLSKWSNKSDDNINGIIKKVNLVQSIQQNNQIHSTVFRNISDLIEKSLKQIDEYRFKIKNSLIEQISNQNSKQLNEIKEKNLFKFTERANIPIELIGKFNENDLTNLIKNSNLKKSDGLDFFILFKRKKKEKFCI